MGLLDEIKKGENKKLEFKEKLSSDYNTFLKTVVAFANGSGGKIVFGINDKTKRIIGISDDELFSLSDKISNLISEKCYPMIIPEIYVQNIDGKNLLIVEIYPGQSKPYFLKHKGNIMKSYIRVGATTRVADENIIKSLEREKLNISYDEEILFSYEPDEKDFNELKKDFYNFTKKELSKNKMLNLKILRMYNKKSFLSIGGALIIGKNDIFEFSGIKCARFKGNDVSEFIDSKDYYGPLYKIADEAMTFAKTHIEKRIIIKDLQHEENFIIPIPVIREAIINAIVHRDYTINSDIKFAIFDNRIEITSPGGLPGNLDVDAIKDGRSEIRNKVIARFFKEIGYIEQWGQV
ncbi:RNA-binding domain-containing protein [Marinitoga lauensis]|uniref:RNA-binding domain-containing protein n=1 Tax=Marinitoga lauensis TaxID=2201189 RepID=UPI001011EB6D|nr:RNA-binding domain-containing protein [Marinitoga lauensis]